MQAQHALGFTQRFDRAVRQRRKEVAKKKDVAKKIADTFIERPLTCTKCYFRSNCEVKVLTKSKATREKIFGRELMFYQGMGFIHWIKSCCKHKVNQMLELFDEPEKNGGLKID